MSISVEQAHELMQAISVDIWNVEDKSQRLELLQKYCSPQIKVYGPDGTITVGIEEVRRTSYQNLADNLLTLKTSVIRSIRDSTMADEMTGRSRQEVICGSTTTC